MNPFDEQIADLKRRRAMQAGNVALSSDRTPEQAQQDIQIGNELGVMPAAVSQDRPNFDAFIRQKRMIKQLENAPRTASWMTNGDNADLSKDDVANLGAIEAVMNSMLRWGYRKSQSYQQLQAQRATKNLHDQNRSFGEILQDEREVLRDDDGKEMARAWIGPTDLFNASVRYGLSRGSSIFGVDKEQDALRHQMAAGTASKTAAAIPMTQGAQNFADKLASFKPSGDMTEDLKTFASMASENPAEFLSFIGQVGIESVPDMVIGMGAGLLTRNPQMAAQFMGMSSGFTEMGTGSTELLEKSGHDLTTAEGARAVLSDADLMARAEERGEARGLVIGSLDALSGGIAGKALANSRVGNMVLQSITQAVIGGGGEALGQYAAREEINIAEVLVEALAEFATAPVEVASMTAHRTGGSIARYLKSGETAQKLEEVDASIAPSQLKQLSPDKFKEFLEAQGADDVDLLIPAEKVQEYFQSLDIPIDAETLSEWGIENDAFERALVANLDVGIPLSTYAANLSGTDAARWIHENATLDEGEMSISEALQYDQIWRDRMDAEQAELALRREEIDAERADAEIINDDLVSQIMATGQYTDSAARDTAIAISSLYTTLAERTGTPALDLWRKYSINIQGDGQQAMVRRRGEVDTAINEIRAAGKGMPATNAERASQIRKEAIKQHPELKLKRPFTQQIMQRGGIAPTRMVDGQAVPTNAAEELAAMGVTPQNSPGLFKKGGATDLDNIVASEIFTSPVLQEDERGYLSPDDVYQALAREQAGEQIPYSVEAQQALEEASALEAEPDPEGVAPIYSGRYGEGSQTARVAALMDAMGLDADTMTNDQIAEAIGEADMRATSATADGMTYDQTEQDQPLAVVHNLTAENLRRVNDLGGIAAPSLAVARGDIGFDTFGEITLVGDQSLADPKRKGVRAYSADVYSPRQPRARYKVKNKDVDAMRQILAPVAEQIGLDIRFDEGSIERDGLAEIAGADVAKAAWLESIGEEIPIVREEAEAAPTQAPEFEAFTSTDRMDLQQDPAFADAVTEAVKKVQVTSIRNKWLGDDGKANGDAVLQFARTVSQTNQRIAEYRGDQEAPVDKYETARAIDKAIQGREIEFGKWVESKFGQLIGDAFLEAANGRKREYTLANVVREMTREVRNGEKWNYGAGSVRAAVAPEFKTLAEVKARRSKVIPADQMDAIADEVNSKLVDLSGRFAEYAPSGNDFGWTDTFAEFMIDMAKGPSALAQWDWVGTVPDSLMQEAVGYLETLKDLPTAYFEVKMQRAVGVSEFSDALIPTDLPADARQILTDAGLNLVEYDRTKDGSRTEALQTIGDRVFFQKKDRKNAAEKLGSIQFPLDGVGKGDTIITVFEGRNLSTLLHETGHLFLEIYKAEASSADTPAQIKEDFAKIEEWLGVKPGEKLTVKHHEKWARGFEAYLFEGRAPSLALQDAFTTFKAWLTRIYQSITALGVKVSPEIRSVMDRMLATDEAIAEARQAQQVGPLFTDRGPAGMSEQDWQTYQKLASRSKDEAEAKLLKRMMDKIRREKTKWWKDERKKMTALVQDEFSRMPQMQLLALLADKRWLRDTTAPVPDIRIDRKALVEIAGEGILAEIGRDRLGGRRAIYGSKGAHPQEVADMFGFGSIMEMLNTLQNTPPYKQALDNEVDLRMSEEFGDVLNDGTIEAEALAAINNDAMAAQIAAEMKAIGNQLNEARTKTGSPRRVENQNARIMKARAKALLSAMTVKEASNPNKFLRASQKAAAEAQAAFAGVVRGGSNSVDRLQAAYDAKEQQVFNSILYRESRDFAASMRSARNRFRTYNSPKTRQAIGSPYIERIDDLLATYEFRERSQKWLSNREAMRAYIEQMTEQGRENELAIDPAIAAQDGGNHYSKMSVSDFRGLDDTVRNIEIMGRRRGKILDARRERDEAEVLAGIRNNIEKNVKHHKVNREGMTAADRRRKIGRDTMNWTLNADTLLREIDGWKDDGEAWIGIKRAIDEGLNDLTKRKMIVAGEMDQIFSAYTDAEKRDMSVRRPNKILGGDFSKWGLITIALNTGNEANFQRLTNPKVQGSFTPDQVEAALQSLDERDWKFVQSMLDYINSFWTEIAEKEKRATGVMPQKVEAQQMVKAPSFVKGGYYPIKYAADQSARADDLSQTQMADMTMGGRLAKAQTNNGHTKERLATSTQPLSLDIGISVAHVNDVIYDLSLSEAVTGSWRILSRLKQDFLNAGRGSDYAALESWIKDVAAGERSAAHGWGKAMQYARTGFTFSRLGLNVGTAIMQPTGLAQSMVVIGKRNTLNGIAKYIRNPGQWSSDVMAVSPFMQERQNTFNRDIHNIMGDIDSAGITGGRRKKFMRDWLVPLSFWMMQKSQFHFVDMPTWIGAYESHIAKGKTEEQARTYADLMVKRAAGSGLISDRGMLERGKFTPTQEMNEMPKLLTALGSYMFSKFNVAYERTMGTNWKSPADVLSWTLDMALLFTLEAVLTAVIRSNLPDEDENWFTWMAKETGMAVMGTMPIVRDMSSALQGFSGGGAGASALDIGAVRPIMEIGSLFEGEEIDRKTVTTMIDSAGIWLHLPSSQTNRLIKAFFDEEMTPTNGGITGALGLAKGAGPGRSLYDLIVDQ